MDRMIHNDVIKCIIFSLIYFLGNIEYVSGSVIDPRLRVSLVNHRVNHGDSYPIFKIRPLEDSNVRLEINRDRINSIEDEICLLQAPGDDDEDSMRLVLTPEMSYDGRECTLYLSSELENGKYVLHIPEKYFNIYREDYEEVTSIEIPEEDMMGLKVGGAWHIAGNKWNHIPLFSVHDDDGMDGQIPSSIPGNLTHGYFSLMYPMLASLGLKGCDSMEGRRVGFTSPTPLANENLGIAHRLQEECGWEIMSHSMKCLGERLNNWAVDNLYSPLAYSILSGDETHEYGNSNNTTVYSREDNRQFEPDESGDWWVESMPRAIKPFVGDHRKGQPILYNKDYDAAYHWGDWFRMADGEGIHSKTWVMHNAQVCHANIPEILKISPYGFADVSEIIYNEPPLTSMACRMLCEGQMFGGVPGENDDNNRFNDKQYKWFREQIDHAAAKGAWIVMGGHFYRNCWDNYIRGSLVSEGGNYPDSWVIPIQNDDDMTDLSAPPSRLGISDWSEWYPCPGTRLEMMWKLLKYAVSKGMKNVTSSEGFEIIGNRVNVGYFTKSRVLGYDKYDFEGKRDLYPHFIVGANEEVYYYNPASSEGLDISLDMEIDRYGFPVVGSDMIDTQTPLAAVRPDGAKAIVTSMSMLPPGIWIVDGLKYVIFR